MRILINVDEVRKDKRKSVRIRVGWQSGCNDDIRVHNCGIEIYKLVEEAFTGGGFTGGEVVIEGERK